MDKRSIRKEVRPVLFEIAVYAVVVSAYCLAVVHFLTAWLTRLFHEERHLYAAMALALIVAQGFLLERLTAFLLARLKRGHARP